MLRLFFLLFFSVLVFYTSPSHAHHPSIPASGGGSGPIITIPASTPAQGSVSVFWTNEFIKYDPFSDAELIAKADSHIHAHSAEYALTSTVHASYGVTDDLMLSLSVPYIYNGDVRASSHSHVGGVTTNRAEGLGDIHGLGDAMLLGKYRFLTGDVQAAVLAGIKLPTGATNKEDDSEDLEDEHQPGSASFDPTFGMAASKQWNGYSFDASFLHAWSTKGHDTDRGDHTSGNLAVSRRVMGGVHTHKDGKDHMHNALDLVLEFNAEWTGRQQDNNSANRHSGGTQLFLSPGLRFIGQDNWSGQLSVSAPVRDNLRSGHTDTDYKIMIGIGKSF